MNETPVGVRQTARRIDATGWSTVILGGVCIGLAVLQAVMPTLLERLAATLDAQDDPTRAMREAWSKGSAQSALVNGAFGLVLIVIGVAVVLRLRWAHVAMRLASWLSIAVLVVIAKPSVAPFLAMADEGAPPRIAVYCGAVVLLAAQIAAVIWFLRFWGRSDVRDAFR